MKVVVDKDIKNFIDLVNELDGLQDIKFTYATSKEINNDLLIDADVLFIRSTTKIDKKLLENSSVKLIGSATAGIDHIDIDYLESSQILGLIALSAGVIASSNSGLENILSAYLSKALH